MITREDPDRIISDCNDVIEYLKLRRDLQPELMKAHYYKGKANYNKGVVHRDKGCLSIADYDFAQVAHNRHADSHMRSMALFHRGVYWKASGIQYSKEYFEKALDKFDKIANDPKTDYDMRAKTFYYCSLCCTELCHNERAECYFEKAEGSGFVDEPQLHYLGSIVQKAEDLKKRVMEELGITPVG